MLRWTIFRNRFGKKTLNRSDNFPIMNAQSGSSGKGETYFRCYKTKSTWLICYNISKNYRLWKKKKKTNTHRPPRWNRNNIRRVPRARNVGTAATPPPWRARTCWIGSWTSKIAAQGTPERGSAPDSDPGRWARSTGCTTFFSCQYERERKKKLVISREECWMKFRFEGRKAGRVQPVRLFPVNCRKIVAAC